MAVNTIFDDVFRTMQEKMPEQTRPLINDVFGTQYPIATSMYFIFAWREASQVSESGIGSFRWSDYKISSTCDKNGMVFTQ